MQKNAVSRKKALFFLTVTGLLLALFTTTFTNAYGCNGCQGSDVQGAVKIIQENHKEGRQHVTNKFIEHRQWLISMFYQENILPALMKMTEQLSAVAMQQVMVIGTFLDAKHQLETQRFLQELQIEAQKDYYPSEDFCWFGTNVRSLAASDSRAQLNALALSQMAMARHLGKAYISGAEGRDEDLRSRWEQFTTNYCDPKDNNWQGGETGLAKACGQNGVADKNRINRDIDYTRFIENARTIDVDFTNDSLPDNGEEEDVLALAKNLYGHHVLTRDLTRTILQENDNAPQLYLGLRSVAAKRSVAENSYQAIVGLKSSGSSGPKTTSQNGAPPPETWKFLGAVLQELGIEDEGEIKQIIGERPSYYAQLEVLAKKIYQNPNFYVNLYDQPTNVARKSVALKAIDLMLDRAIYESQLRQEMAMSVMLSSKLRPQFREINRSSKK